MFLLSGLVSCSQFTQPTVTQNGNYLSNDDKSLPPLSELAESEPSPEPTLPYPGKSIDQVFPILFERSRTNEEEIDSEKYSFKIDRYAIQFDQLTPISITTGTKMLSKFNARSKGEYSSTLAGKSKLLGANSNEIWVVATGPGAVCCTNYWIFDISNPNPRLIFRSEDYGMFRNPMEVFDADGDGRYELVQFDSAFRYFMDDCGSCSPEPRAIFKYDKKLGKYIPAKNIQQDFVKTYFRESEKWILESFEKLKNFEQNDETETQEYLTLKQDYRRGFLNHIVDTFYLGNNRKAWAMFEKYYIGFNEKREVRAEIKNRLRHSKFYQALRRSP
ncbi:MAG: hypothetical protein KIS76_08180 [Pyrinomonadaceae bacterium]|nr:hypothetical protein [Pyrinomonadaceae bacterium]